MFIIAVFIGGGVLAYRYWLAPPKMEKYENIQELVKYTGLENIKRFKEEAKAREEIEREKEQIKKEMVEEMKKWPGAGGGPGAYGEEPVPPGNWQVMGEEFPLEIIRPGRDVKGWDIYRNYEAGYETEHLARWIVMRRQFSNCGESCKCVEDLLIQNMPYVSFPGNGPGEGSVFGITILEFSSPSPLTLRNLIMSWDIPEVDKQKQINSIETMTIAGVEREVLRSKPIFVGQKAGPAVEVPPWQGFVWFVDNNKLYKLDYLSGSPEQFAKDLPIFEEMVSFFSITLLDLGKKVYVLHNGNSDEKIDLLFVPQNIADISMLGSKINDILYKSGTDINGEAMVSLFNIEPFSDYESKFNIAYINKNIDEDFFDCWREMPNPEAPPKWHLRHGCNEDKIKDAYGVVFDTDFIVIIFDLPSGYHSSGGEVQYLDVDLESSDRFAFLSWTFIHEFGHQFGGLVDEYVYTESPSYHCGMASSYECFEDYEKVVEIYPNVDVLGCPKWCESYDIDKLIEENKPCEGADTEEECKALTNEYYGLPSCSWFKLEHPFFKTHCVIAQGGNSIGINCEEGTQCIFGGDYGQLAFNPGGSSIMGGGTEFTKPSRDHLKSILECCYPRQGTEFCINFRDKFENLPDSINPYFRTAYDKIVSCP